MNALSNVKKGSLRDNDILEAIELCGVMDTEQITQLFFRFPTGKRKCQARMKSLYDRKLVKKIRLSLDTPTIYYQGKFPEQIKHSLAVSWVYVWMKRREGEKILTWDTEQLKEFNLRVDVLCSTKILMTKEIRWYCIEIDRGSVSKNKYLKVNIYDELYTKEGFPESKLMKRLDNPLRFPKVILVTDSAEQKQKILSLVAESKTKVRFEVYLFSYIRSLLL